MNKNNLLPWLDSPDRLVSWFDMERFFAIKYFNVGKSIEWIRRELPNYQSDDAEYVRKNISDTFRRLAASLEELGFEHASCISQGLCAEIRDKKPIEFILGKMDSLETLIQGDLRKNLFLWVPSKRASYYSKSAKEAMGDDFANRFPDCILDAEEGMKCFALAQYTASVFHFMRVTEGGMKAFAGCIQYSQKSNNWGNVFKEFDKQMSMDRPKRPTIYQQEEEFLNDIGGYLRAIKNSWRNTTMHLDKSYTEDMAEEIMRAVLGFMRQLSGRVNQFGVFV